MNWREGEIVIKIYVSPHVDQCTCHVGVARFDTVQKVVVEALMKGWHAVKAAPYAMLNGMLGLVIVSTGLLKWARTILTRSSVSALGL